MSTGWRRTLQRWWYTVVDAPRAIGRPQARRSWDEEYRDGRWDKLDSTAQLAHYAVIAGYVRHFYPDGARLLDVGCGHGALFRAVCHLPFASYLGLDLSEVAIAKAARAPDARARFEVADFEKWTPRSRFDVIVFNESIYYARQPVDELMRYAQALDGQGLLIVSVVRSSMNWAIGRAIRRRFAAVAATRVRNEQGESWDVLVLRPIRAPSSLVARPQPLKLPQPDERDRNQMDDVED